MEKSGWKRGKRWVLGRVGDKVGSGEGVIDVNIPPKSSIKSGQSAMEAKCFIVGKSFVRLCQVFE